MKPIHVAIVALIVAFVLVLFGFTYWVAWNQGVIPTYILWVLFLIVLPVIYLVTKRS